ncbi:MAG: restriction endonuclease subunit S [Candidatus Amulumruptor caecigallinarius]|nr:restriction endonuclease subunit S [Candidatus Amulumruptor caecigallinarius]MCM1395919.1 restriction endonuclease subunit S [Candidatus Amulumruptor caecigallinarius]MCM1452954.1 restriction endonuclease subunit S [bacterium]
MENNTPMRRLGDFIRQVDVRNKDLAVTNLVGLSIDKIYIPSVANTVGTDLSNYKIIRENQFACSLMQVSRDKKMPIAVYKGDDAIMSPAYPIFEITNEEILLPDYLHLWFLRSEFDREVTFYAVGGVRGSLEWSDFCDLLIPVPPIEEQRAIVARHKAIEHKIDVNRRLIAALEETARTIYRHTFVDNIDPENLPQGWLKGKLSDIAEISSGKTCKNKQDYKDSQFKYPVAGAAGIIGWSTEYNQDVPLLTTGRVGTLGVVNRYYGLTYTADNVLVIKSHWFEYCNQILKNFDYEEITKGGVQALITQTELSKIDIVIPSETALEEFELKVGNLSKLLLEYTREIDKISKLSSL